MSWTLFKKYYPYARSKGDGMQAKSVCARTGEKGDIKLENLSVNTLWVTGMGD